MSRARRPLASCIVQVAQIGIWFDAVHLACANIIASHLTLKFLHHHIAHHELLRLARDRHR